MPFIRTQCRAAVCCSRGSSKGAGQWPPPHIVHTTVRPLREAFLTALITTAAARASSPDVGSLQRSCKGWEGEGGGRLANRQARLCATEQRSTQRAAWKIAGRSMVQHSTTAEQRSKPQHSAAQHDSLHKNNGRVCHQLHSDGQPLALLRAERAAGEAHQAAGDAVQLNQGHLLRRGCQGRCKRNGNGQNERELGPKRPHSMHGVPSGHISLTSSTKASTTSRLRPAGRRSLALQESRRGQRWAGQQAAARRLTMSATAC